MTLEQYTILAYHFLYLTFFIPTLYDVLKFVPKKTKNPLDQIDQYIAYTGKRLWNTHFGDLFVGIALAIIWPVISVFSVCFILYKSFSILKKQKNKKNLKTKKNKIK